MKISFKYCLAILFAILNLTAYGQLPSLMFGNNGNSNGCAPHTIVFNISNFSANSSNTNYFLDFGDGTPGINYTQATLPSTVSHTYTQISCGEVFNGNQNTFGATLTATNASGSTTGTVFPIRISRKPIAAFILSTPVICAGGSITFTNTSDPGVTYTGNTCNTNPPFYWHVTGPSAGSVTSGSLGTNNGFANQIAAWTPGTSSLTMQFATPGSYQMKLSIGNSCGIDDTTIAFTVTDGIGITLNNIILCQGSSAVLGVGMEVTDSVTSFSWSGPNGFTSTLQYPILNNPQPGTYTLTIPSPGCGAVSETLTLSITSTNCPNTAFTNTSGVICSGNSVSFTNQSTPAGSSYYWFFGDGGSANTFNASHVYTAPQGTSITNYTATLVVINTAGVMDVQQSTIQVQQIPPEPLLGSSQFQLYNNQDYLVACTDLSNDYIFITGLLNSPGAWAQSFTINWGDGSSIESFTAPLSFTNHLYQLGLYTLTITMLGPNGCSIANTYPVFVGNTPAVSLGSPSNTEQCAPYTINFPIQNVGNNEVGTTYVVTFSDGGPSQTFNHPPPAVVSHTFSESSCGQTSLSNLPNSFGVQITAQNPCAIAFSTLEPIRISSKPHASFNVTSSDVCLGGTIVFTNNSDPGAVITGSGNACNTNAPYYWQIEGPNGGIIQNGSLGNTNSIPSNPVAWTTGSNSIEIEFNTLGTYQMRLFCGNSCGIDDTVITFNVTNTGAGIDAGEDLSICINSPPLNLQGFPSGGAWFGVGVTPAGIFTPTVEGSFEIGYQYTQGSCTFLDTILIIVLPTPTITFSDDTVCSIQGVSLFANVSGGLAPYQLSWAPSTGLSSITGNSVFASPTSITTYSVNALDSNGCATLAPTFVTVIPINNVNAGNDFTVCSNSISVVLNEYSPAGGFWSGTGVTPAGLFTPISAGNVVLTYTVCDASDQIMLTVVDAPEINAGADLFVCFNADPITLTGTPAGGTWSGTGVNASGLFTPSNAGTFDLTYSYTSGVCTVSDVKTITVSPELSVLVPNYSLCAGSSTTLTAIVSGGTTPYTYNWSPNGSLSSINGATAIAQPSVSTTYELTVTDANGCITNDSASVTVVPLPLVNAGPDISLCYANSATALSGFSPAGGTWSGTGVIASGQFTPSTLGTNTLTYSVTQNNCTATDAIVVEVIALPDVNAGPDLFLCRSGNPFTLTGGLPAGGNWSGIYVNNNVLSTNINATGILTYTYTENGCIGTDQISVSINDTLNVQAGSDFEMCVGDSIQLNGSPAGGYWAGAEGLNASGLFVPLNQQVVLLSYVISNTNCPTAADVMVLVADTPSVSFNLPGAVFCTADTDVPLSGGNPEGGTYSGEAIANNRMNPSLLQPGSYVVAYDYTAASGCTARDTALIRIEECTGMFQIGSITPLRIFPNPGKGLFHIEVAALNSAAQLFVYNSSGGLVATNTMDNRSSILDMSMHAPGIYFVRIEANGSLVGQQKMVVLE